jgi:hypothetical protein
MGKEARELYCRRVDSVGKDEYFAAFSIVDQAIRNDGET